MSSVRCHCSRVDIDGRLGSFGTSSGRVSDIVDNVRKRKASTGRSTSNLFPASEGMEGPEWTNGAETHTYCRTGKSTPVLRKPQTSDQRHEARLASRFSPLTARPS